jgi:hypothetical protein
VTWSAEQSHSFVTFIGGYHSFWGKTRITFPALSFVLVDPTCLEPCSAQNTKKSSWMTNRDGHGQLHRAAFLETAYGTGCEDASAHADAVKASAQ